MVGIVVVVTGCVTTTQHELTTAYTELAEIFETSVLSGWIGKTETELLAVYGEPHKRESTSDSTVVFSFLNAEKSQYKIPAHIAVYTDAYYDAPTDYRKSCPDVCAILFYLDTGRRITNIDTMQASRSLIQPPQDWLPDEQFLAAYHTYDAQLQRQRKARITTGIIETIATVLYDSDTAAAAQAQK